MSVAAHAQREIFGYWERLKAEYDRYDLVVRTMTDNRLLRLQEDLRRYLCLRCAGFLEKLFHLGIQSYIERNSYGSVQAFAMSHFTRAPNLTAAALVKLIRRLGADHEAKLEKFLEVSARREVLNNLLDIRNHVAHGDIGNSGKLAPAPYVALCEDLYKWVADELLTD